MIKLAWKQAQHEPYLEILWEMTYWGDSRQNSHQFLRNFSVLVEIILFNHLAFVTNFHRVLLVTLIIKYFGCIHLSLMVGWYLLRLHQSVTYRKFMYVKVIYLLSWYPFPEEHKISQLISWGGRSLVSLPPFLFLWADWFIKSVLKCNLESRKLTLFILSILNGLVCRKY